MSRSNRGGKPAGFELDSKQAEKKWGGMGCSNKMAKKELRRKNRDAAKHEIVQG